MAHFASNGQSKRSGRSQPCRTCAIRMDREYGLCPIHIAV